MEKKSDFFPSPPQAPKQDTAAERLRQKLRELDAEYREIAGLADKLLTGAQEKKKVDFFALDYLQQPSS